MRGFMYKSSGIASCLSQCACAYLDKKRKSQLSHGQGALSAKPRHSEEYTITHLLDGPRTR